ncbi:MAG: MATE family efflux transporter, partial [Alphaproteobacteria bacterium]|nr:MATE family efflux transporter [Alphaproteobacteria bacterium]
MRRTRSSAARKPKRDLSQGPIRGHMIRMTIPMIWGILAVIGFQLVDMYFISLLGTRELAAISFTFPVTYFVFAVTMGVSIATSSVLSRLIGRGEWYKVRRIASHALILAAALGGFFSLLGLLFQTPLFRLLGAETHSLPLIRAYMDVWFLGAVFLTLPVVGNAAIRATGSATTPAAIMVLATLINIIFDPLLIFGLFGFPALGLQGAALATVLANLVAAGVGFYVLKVKKDMIVRSSWHGKLFADSLKRLLVIAVPAGLMQALQPVANAVIIALLAQESAHAVASFGIASRVEAFTMVIVMALSVGMGPILGQNQGAGNGERVSETIRKALGFTMVWSLLTAVILALYARPIAGLFSRDPAVIEPATLYFWIVPASYVLGNLVHVWASAFNALGASRRSFSLIFFKMIALRIPMSIAGGLAGGPPGVFAGIALSNLVSGAGWHFANKRFVALKIEENIL